MRLLYCVLCVMSLQCMAAEEYTLYFSRHAEKISTTDSDPALTKKGQHRAQALADYLFDKNIQDIYSTQTKRSQQTAQALVKKLDQMLAFYDTQDLSVLAKILRSQKRNALVVGHSNTIPQLVHLVGGQASSIDENQYGDLFAVTFVDESIITTVEPLPPFPEGELAPLMFDLSRLPSEKSRYRVLLNGEDIGYQILDRVVKDEQIEITQITMSSATRTNMIVKTFVNKTTLLPLQIRMSGSDGKAVDVQMTFADNHVTGHSHKQRPYFLTQGQVDVDQWLPPFSYLKETIFATVGALKYQQQDQYFRWFDAENIEVKRVRLHLAETTVVDKDGLQQPMDVVHLTGGAPSYIFYLSPEQHEVLKIEIPVQGLTFEKVPLE